MPFLSTRQGGFCFAFPDVCKTPSPGGPVPLPYSNRADLVQANPATTSLKVTIMNQTAVVLDTTITMSAGDEAGSLGCVISNMIKGPAQFKKGSMKVYIEGQPAVMHTSACSQNGVNANSPAGIQASPSQTKVNAAF